MALEDTVTNLQFRFASESSESESGMTSPAHSTQPQKENMTTDDFATALAGELR